MRRERVSDDIYVFTSKIYAQVTASAVVTRDGIIVIDTLPYAVETKEMINYLNSLGQGRIQYVVNTHWHGDHTYGNYLFDDSVEFVSHKKCQKFMAKKGQLVLDISKENTPMLEDVKLRIPEVVFDEGQLVLHVGNKSVELISSPGHTPDSIMAYVREDKVLLAADTMMPVPHFIWGDRLVFIESLKFLHTYTLESIVQGHGEVLLRGEIPAAIDSSIHYMELLAHKVAEIVKRGEGREALNRITIESCGKSRIPLNGLVQDLHITNIQFLYKQILANERISE